MSQPDLDAVRRAVAAIPDPELPTLTIDDLGVLRSVRQVGDRVVVTITPTYSGCPAMDLIRHQAEEALTASGVDGEVVTELSPAWTSAWISQEGRAKLAAAGIAPPARRPRPPARAGTPVSLGPETAAVRCPRCGSARTETISWFGSTACKALLRCLDCLEPFDYVKEI